MRPIHQLLLLIAFLAAITWNITALLVEEQPTTVATITTQQRAQVASLLNGLVAHYSFDEGSGTTAGDAGTSGPFNGTLVGGATWTAGKVGSGAVSLNGTGQYVDIPGFSSLNGANAATVSFWVKPAANSKPFVGKWGTGRLFDISSAGTSVSVYWRVGGSGGTGTSFNQSTPAGVVVNGSWNHVVVVYNNPSSTIYVNGVSVSSVTGAGGSLNAAVNDPLRFGWSNAPAYLSGDMDDVRLYNRAVSAQEVSDLFALGSGSTPAGNTGGNTGGGTTPPPSNTNQAPVVTLPTSASGTLSSGGTVVVALSGSATDDGLPSNTLSYTWSLSSGPSSVTFTSANSASTGVTFTTAGTYTINLAVSDGALTSAKTISVTIAAANSNPVTPPPTNPPVTSTVPPECSSSAVKCVPEEYTTIQLCANAAVAGDTCLVNAGSYLEQVVTKSGGTSDSNRVTFKANGAVGTVIARGFDIRHPYVTVNGFDITGTSANQQYIGITKGGDNCQILNNYIHDGQRLVYGISFYSSSSTGNISGNSCLVKGNRLARLNYQFMATDGNGHRFENNIFEEGGGWDLLRVFGQDHVFYRNIFRNSAPASGIGNHPDFIQSFSDNGGRSFNMLFEENWIEGLSANSATGYQLGQMNSGGGMNDPKLSPYFHDYTFRRNIFANVSNNWNLGMPGFFFENNTFYRAAYTQGGLGSGGSLTRGDSSRLTYLSNAFIGGGTGSDTNGFYSNSGAGLGQEVLRFYVTMEPATEANPLTPIAAGIMNDLIANGYVNGNGQPTAKGKALASVNDFVIAPAYASYKDGVYTYLKMTTDLDNNIKNTFSANYNFVSGPASAGYPAKRADGCTSGINTNFRFCEPNGVNGGDPKLKDVNDPDGPDNIPFTTDDGFKPLPGSPLCAKGANGVDIGVYSCDPSKVFATGNSGTAGITGGNYVPPTPGTPSNPPAQPPASTNTLYVSNSGSDTNAGTQAAPLKTIQKCANIAPAGTTCLVTAGIYPEHVETLQSGQSGKYITFKAQGTVTMKGFRIKNPYIRIEGFDITKYDVGLDQGHIALEPEADYAQIVNNTIRDGIYLTSTNFTFNGANKTITNPSGGFIAAGFVPGITIYIGSDINNQIQNHDNNGAVPYKYETKRVVAVTDTTITLDAANTVFSEGPVPATIYANKAEKNGVWGIIFNSSSGRGQPDNTLVQGNTFRNLAGKGIQVSGSNNIIERNVFDRMNGWRMIAFYGNNNVFRYNTFKDSPRWPGFQLPRPGTVFALGSGSWDMYDTLMTSTGSTDQTVIDNIFEYNFIKDIDEQLASVEEATSVGTPLQNRGLYIRNNVFMNVEMSGSFTRPQTILTNNTFYKSARISTHNFVIGKSSHGNPAGSVIKNNAFVDSGMPGTEDRGWYSVRGDDGLPTAGVLADYNFVAGSASLGYPSKPSFKTATLELNGINGGDPKFVNPSNPFGNDGVAFTPDDGLVPLSTSPLCRGGEGGNYIGAYPCPGVSYSGVTQPPTPQQPPTVQPPVVPPVVPPTVQPPSTFTLTVSKTGTGSGTVEGQGIACGSDCSETVAANTRIILSATPAVGSTFTGWSGACTGTAACSVILNSATALVAHFALVTQQTQTQDQNQNQNQNQTQQPPNQNQTPEAVSNTFSANVRVQTTFPLSVRSDYGISSVSIGSQSQSSHGTIIGTSKSKDGFFWWNVNFDFGVDGWVAENYLIGDKTLVDQAEQARIQQAQQRLQEANRTVAQPLIPTTSNASYKSFTFTQSLRAGTAGNQVTVLQDLLKDAGFLSGTYTKGTFDSATEQAVKTFQRQNGIVSSGTPDTTGYGALGPRTRAAFTTFARTFNGNSGSNPIGTGSSVAPITETPNTAVNQTAPAPVAGGGIVIAKLPKFTRPLILGANGPDVKNLQIFLNYSGYPIATAGVGSRGKETTFFGPATRRALIRYQEVNRSEILTPAGLRNGTGYFGPSTIKRVNKTIGK